MFNADLGCAIEYMGKQHYEDIPHFHRGENSFAKLQAYDQAKADILAKRGIKLLHIPYTVKKEEFYHVIAAWLTGQAVCVDLVQNPYKSPIHMIPQLDKMTALNQEVHSVIDGRYKSLTPIASSSDHLHLQCIHCGSLTSSSKFYHVRRKVPRCRATFGL